MTSKSKITENLKLTPNETENDILLKIRSRMPHLTKKETKIAEFILYSPSEASIWGLDQIAKYCCVSITTVSRFAGRLGFSSFKGFQVNLARSNPHEETDLDDILFSDESPNQVVRKIFKINCQGLAETESLLDKAALLDVAYAVAKAPRVVLFGIGGSGVIAKDGEIRLSHLGIHAQAFSDVYQMVVASANLTAEDVAIAISHTGQTRHVVSNARRARENGAMVVGITNYSMSPLALACHKLLLTSYRERSIHAAKTSSHLAQLCVMDCLYFLVAQIKAGQIKEKTDQLDQQIHQEIR